MRWRVWISGLRRAFGGFHPGDALEEAADRHRVGGVVGALVDHLQHVGAADDAGGELNAAGAPAVGHRHLAAAERHLIAGDRHRLEDGAADHALGLLVQITEVIAGQYFTHRGPPDARCIPVAAA